MPENSTPRKTVTYRAHLPLNLQDWTVDKIRQFVQDADAQGIPGSTHVRMFPENSTYAFQSDSRYYGLGVERVVNLDEEIPVHFSVPCMYPGCGIHQYPAA